MTEDDIFHRAERNLLTTDFQPVTFIVVDQNGLLPMVPIGAEAHRIFPAVVTMFKEATAVILVCEAWSSASAGCWPADDPTRREELILMAYYTPISLKTPNPSQRMPQPDLLIHRYFHRHPDGHVVFDGELLREKRRAS